VTAAPTVAVLGGGQLGRMLALAGIPFGLRFRFLDPSPDAPARDVGTLLVGELGAPDALDDVARGAIAVTYEWEGVPAEAARALGPLVAPSWRALEAAQDRLVEKQLLASLGVPTARFVPVDDDAALHRAVDDLGFPCVVKTRRGGYDGKGQRVLREAGDVAGAFAAVGAVPAIVEEWIPFDRELSIIAARGRDGTVVCWPLVENDHRDGILRTSLAPALRTDAGVEAEAHAIVKRLLAKLDYVGVLTVELFDVGGRLLANELAPRVHNSGHWTIEGARTSQFENHVRAVVGWPLGPVDAIGHSAMVNCIGALPDPEVVLALDGVHLHRYGKELRPGRKVGHLTVVGADAGERDARLQALRALLPADRG